MVIVKVKTFATMRDLLGPSFKMKLEKNITVGDLLNEIFRKYGGHVKDRMMDPKTGEVFEAFKILKNGRNIYFLQDLETPLNDGDEVIIFPPVAGG